MNRSLFCFVVFLIIFSPNNSYSQADDADNLWLDTYINNPNWGKLIFHDDFSSDSDFWTEMDNQYFRVQVANDRLEIERKDPVNSRACLWYSLPVQEFSLRDDYRIKLEFTFIDSDILTTEMDFLWGNSHRASDTMDLKMVRLGADGGVLLTHINKHRNPMYMNHYSGRHSQIINADRNKVMIERIGPDITVFINGTEIRSFPARHGNTPDHHSIGFQACRGAEWALNSVEIRTRESRSLDRLIGVLLEGKMKLGGTRTHKNLIEYHPGYHKVSKLWESTYEEYLLMGQVFYRGYDPDLVMLTGLKGEYFDQIEFFNLTNLEFTEGQIRARTFPNYRDMLYPSAMSDLVADDTPFPVIQWLERNASIIYETTWGHNITARDGDLQWRLSYPHTRRFTADIANYITSWSGTLHWMGEAFAPVNYNTNNYVFEKSRIKIFGRVSLDGTTSYFEEKLGEPTGKFLEEVACVGGLYHTWNGIRVDISNPNNSYVETLDFTSDPQLWITVSDEFRFSGATTIQQFLEVMPSFRADFASRMDEEELIIPLDFTIPHESSHWFRFVDGKLASYHYNVWC